jgi:phosphomevalonate kinase
MTKVPVEPTEFNELLDEISTLEGVIYCICPGSGGYDAIAILAITADENQLKEDMS